MAQNQNVFIMIYFDNNSTTPVIAKVIDRILPCFNSFYGNASSKTHAFGWQADELVKIARKQLSDAIGAEEQEIIFNSGATESIHIALQIIADNYSSKGKHIISCVTEHKALLDGLKKLEKNGFEVSLLKVNSEGQIDLNELEYAIRTDTIAVCLMHANNETGLIHPVDVVGELCEKKQILFFSDCTQSLGKIKVDVKSMKMAMACFSAHKLHGPKGIGALYISRKSPRVALRNTCIAGAHENGLRPGTLNVPGIVGMGAAVALAHQEGESRTNFLRELRDHFESELKKYFNIIIHCDSQNRLPNTSNVCFVDFNNTELIKKLPKLAFATGSACTSMNNEPSHVLAAMGARASHSIRFSFGVQNTMTEIEHAIQYIKDRLLNS